MVPRPVVFRIAVVHWIDDLPGQVIHRPGDGAARPTHMTRGTQMKWRYGVALTYFVMVLAIAGCPTSNAVVDWPTDRLDSNVASSQPAAVQVADMDGDGLKDTVSVWRGSTSISGTPGTVVVNFQVSGGGWQTISLDAESKTKITTTTTTNGTAESTTTEIPRYADANAISVADVNKDGRPDVLVANGNHITYMQSPANPGDTKDTLKWQIFDIVPYEVTPTSTAPLFDACYDLAAADIDGKNGLDIVATLNDLGRLVWFESPADPATADGWTLHNIDPSRARADSIKLLDMNGDTVIDVVSSATQNTTSAISWYEHPSDLTVAQWTKHIMTGFSGATRFDFGDLDGDGQIDMAAISPTTRQVAWFPHPAQATDVWNGWVLKDYTKITGDTREPTDLSIADMNGDGQLDVVVVSNNPASIFFYSPRSDNKATWAEYRIAAIADIGFSLSAVNDILNRGLIDVIVPVTHDTESSFDRIDRYINPGQ